VDLPLATVWGFGLLLFRTTGLCLTAPMLGARIVPQRIRLAISVALTAAIYTGIGMPGVPLPSSILGLGAAAAVETATGLISGLAARWLLDAALAAGHLAGLSAGLGFSALVDPTTGAESNGLSQLLFAGAQGAALSLGIHREAVGWLARSAQLWPPGSHVDLASLASRLVGQTVVAISLSVRLAFPVLAAVLLGHACMGVMSRMAPQLNLGNVGFSVAILAGGLAVYLAAPAAAEMAARAAVAAFQG
jgi:flagellar biosynthetic protein FliR